MDNVPKISVIIPIYKVEEYLNQCIDSVLQQTYTNIEVVLVDDGSPDNCPIICDDYAQKDARVKVIHKENGGLSDARNAGLENATGEYVVFLDSDDYWDDTNGLQLLINILSVDRNADIIFFQKKIYVRDKCFIPTEIDVDQINGNDKLSVLKYLTYRGDLLTSAYLKLIRKSLLIDENIFFEKGLLSEDLDWSLQLYLKARSFYAINNPFYGYRKRAGSITTSMREKNFSDLLYIINKWKTLIPIQNISKEEKKIYMGFLCYEYCILMGLLGKTNSETRNKIKLRIKEHKDLLQYDVNYKTHQVIILHRLLGFNITCWILQQYIKYRSKSF